MPTIIVGAIVFGGIAYAVYSLVRSRKNGSSCSCGCDHCDVASKSKNCH